MILRSKETEWSFLIEMVQIIVKLAIFVLLSYSLMKNFCAYKYLKIFLLIEIICKGEFLKIFSKHT